MLDIAPRIRSEDVAALPAAERIAYLRRTIDGAIVFTHGFGIEGQLIFHWICERDLDIDVVTLDTGRLFPETYQLWAQTERHYGRRIRAIYPNRAALERLVAKQGIDGIYEFEAGARGMLRRAQEQAARSRAFRRGGLDHRPARRPECEPARCRAGRLSTSAAACSSSTRFTIGRARPCWQRCSRLEVPINSSARQRFCFDWLRAVHARAAPRRARAQRPLVVGTGMAARNAGCICRGSGIRCQWSVISNQQSVIISNQKCTF